MTAPSLRLDGFQIVRHIGAGGLGDVFVARRHSTGGEVAIKLLREVGSVEDVERRIGRELEALLMLKGHPGVIQIEEILQTANGPAIVMEYAPGGSLRDEIVERGRLQVDEVAQVGCDVGALLADAHLLGVIHRDVKPHNILRTSFGTYKMCDFGIAALWQRERRGEQTSALSYRYASPEELDGLGATPASDVFSLGVTLLQAWTGATSGVRSIDTVRLIPKSPDDHALVDLISGMLHDRPDRRPSARAVSDASASIAVGSPLDLMADDDTVRRNPPAGPTLERLELTPSPGPAAGELPAPTTHDRWWD